MSIRFRFAAPVLAALALLFLNPPAADAQRGGARAHPVHPPPAPVIRGQVFIGGYFYDPVFGPYPWWPRTIYPYRYFPIYDLRAEVRIQVVPDEADQAAVYVDGFYAGVVNDFDGVFQSLPLPPGGHRIVIYSEGYRTIRHNIYLQPGSTFRIRETLQRLPAGETSELPEQSPPVPPPPPGSYTMPVTPDRGTAPQAGAVAPATGFGTVDLFIQPSNAEVFIDGQRWRSSDEGHFIIQLPAGKHRVEVRRPGYRTYRTEIDVPEGSVMPLNVSLMAITS